MMSEQDHYRVLCVDDDPNVLEGLSRVLSRQFRITTALGGARGLQVLEDEGPFAVVISDLRMPQIDGVRFLAYAQKLSPSSVRILLTGNLDVAAAVSAVNEGAIFRLLIKPCSPHALSTAITDAFKQHELITAEQVLLRQTLFGSLRALLNLLSTSCPGAYGRASRILTLLSEVGPEVGIGSSWEGRIAALLSQMGALTLPQDVMTRLYSGEELTTEEGLLNSRLPLLTAEVLSDLPRLEGVCEILEQQTYRLDGVGSPDGAPRGSDIRIESRVLKVIADYDVLTSAGLSSGAALDELAKRTGIYDSDVVLALRRCRGERYQRPATADVDLDQLRTGMVLADDVRNHSGLLLAARGQEISSRLISRLQRLVGDEVVAGPVTVVAGSDGE